MAEHAAVTRLLTRRHNRTPARAGQIAEQHPALITAIAAHDVEAAGEMPAELRDASEALIERMRSEGQEPLQTVVFSCFGGRARIAASFTSTPQPGPVGRT